jgi:hypothetical protein
MCCPRVSERYHMLTTCVWTLPCAVHVCLNVIMCCPCVSERYHVLSACVCTLPCAVHVCLNVTICCPRVSERYHVLSTCVWTLPCAVRVCLNVTMCCPRVSERYHCNSWIRWSFPQISSETLLLDSSNIIIFVLYTTYWQHGDCCKYETPASIATATSESWNYVRLKTARSTLPLKAFL